MSKKKTENNSANTITYTYESLVNSKRYDEHNWAARVALDKDKRYTLEEADKAVSDYLNQKVVM